MGYSSTAIASIVLTQMLVVLSKEPGNEDYAISNGWKKNGREYFYEIGREHEDGRITGTIVFTDTGRRAGHLHITAKGKIIDFATTTQTQRLQAEAKGLAEFLRIFGQAQTDHDCDPSLGVPPPTRKQRLVNQAVDKILGKEEAIIPIDKDNKLGHTEVSLSMRTQKDYFESQEDV